MPILWVWRAIAFTIFGQLVGGGVSCYAGRGNLYLYVSGLLPYLPRLYDFFKLVDDFLRRQVLGVNFDGVFGLP